MRRTLEAGYVLHTRPYRNNSLLVEYFSREQGRVALVARGAKGRKTRGGSLVALLQPFAPLLCSWWGRGELKTLTACEPERPGLSLQRSRLYSGLYVNELLVRLLHHDDPHQALFVHYATALQGLANSGRDSSNEEQLLRQFELALLQQLGYGFDLQLDGVSGEPLFDDAWYHYHQDYGLVMAGAGASGRVPRYRGRYLRQIAAGDFSGGGRSCAKHLLRQVLASHLGGKPLHSRALFRQCA